MARRTTKTAEAAPARKRGGRTAKAKATTKAVKTTTNGDGRRTHEERLAEVPAIVKRIKAGDTLGEIREEYGPIRAILAEAGYNTKGEKVEFDPINGSGATLAKRVAAARKSGDNWIVLAIRTGKSQADLKELLEEHGYGELASGRVLKEQDEAPAPKRTRKAKAAEATTTTRKRGRKAATEDEEEAPAPRRRGRRKVAANPS